MTENFARRLEATARRFPERPALVWDGGALTYAEVDRRAAAVASWLAGQGAGPGDRVALAIPNRWQFVAAALGGFKRGVIVAPLDPRLTEDERRSILEDLSPALVVDDVPASAGSRTPEATVGAPALVLYTSGSTGRPKGALLSHAALGFAVESWAGPVMALGPGDVVLAVLPLSHSFGLNGALLAPLLVGATVVLLERFSPEGVIETIRERRVTVFPGVATMFRRVLGVPACSRESLRSLRLAVAGAAPCPWDLACAWRERTGVRILRGYGMTELFRPVSYLAADPTDLPDSIGRPVPGVEARIVDDDGRRLPLGAVGELRLRTPAAMDAYLGAPEETRAVLRDGWFLTGDLATLTPEGYVRIVGRKRERILRGGYSVFPQEVEAVLLAHPAVAEAAVVGAPHEELGEEVVAFVVLRDETPGTADELIVHCRERLASYKCPRRVEIVDSLPRGATGKVLKSRLRTR